MDVSEGAKVVSRAGMRKHAREISPGGTRVIPYSRYEEMESKNDIGHRYPHDHDHHSGAEHRRIHSLRYYEVGHGHERKSDEDYEEAERLTEEYRKKHHDIVHEGLSRTQSPARPTRRSGRLSSELSGKSSKCK